MVSRLSTCAVIVTVGALAACEFEEVMIPEAEPILVIHSVINTAEPQQYVVVENSLTGGLGQVNVVYSGLIPFRPARSGVEDAKVTITFETPRASCSQPTVTLTEAPDYDGHEGPVPTGVYVTEDLCPLQTDDVLLLEVIAPDGRRATGRTRIPGFSSLSMQNRVVGGDTIPLLRNTDSLRIAATMRSARAMQIDVIRADRIERDPNVGWDLPYSFVMDTTAVTIAGTAVLPFVGQGHPIFSPGRFYAVTASVVDSNYYDFARSGSDEFTGRGFINHVVGGIGVFGSMAPVTRIVRVTAERRDPREGTYRVQGAIAGQAVDLTLELYMNDNPEFYYDTAAFAAFTEGVWIGSPLAVSADGAFDGVIPWHSDVHPFSLFWTVPNTSGTTRYFLSGGDPNVTGQPTAVDVRTDSPDPIGALTLERIR